MGLTSVDPDPNPGEAGYYSWHEDVGVGHNQLASALNAAAAGDLLGADANSDLQAIAAGTFEQTTNKGVASGYAGLDSNAEVPFAQLPFASDTYSRVQDSALTLTVGSGGDHSNLREALEALSRLQPFFVNDGLTATVTLLSGFVLEQQIALIGPHNFSWVTLSSEDAEVSVDRSQLPTSHEGAPFYAEDGALLPIIDVLFRITGTSGGGQRGFWLQGSSYARFTAGSGCLDAVERGIVIADGSVAIARGTDWSGTGDIGARIANLGVGHFDSATIRNCTNNVAVGNGTFLGADGDFSDAIERNIYNAPGPALIQARRANLDGAGTNALNIARGGSADITDASALNAGGDAVYVQDTGEATCSGVDTTGHGGDGFVAEDGGHIYAAGSTGTVRTSGGGTVSGRSDAKRHQPVASDMVVATRETSGRFVFPAVPVAEQQLANELLHAVPLQVHSHFDTIGIRVETAGETGSVIRLGVYDNDGGHPGVLLLDAGTVAGDTAPANATITIAESLAGWVWVAAVAQSASTTPPSVLCLTQSPPGASASSFGRFAIGDKISYRHNANVSGALPDPFAVENSRGSSAGDAPAVLLRAA